MSFLPMILLNAGVNERSAWMTSSIIFVAYFVSIVSYRFYEFRRVGTAMPRPLSLGIAFLGLCAALQIVNAVLIRDSWPYLVRIVGYVVSTRSSCSLICCGPFGVNNRTPTA
jgi:hypothetical protein